MLKTYEMINNYSDEEIAAIEEALLEECATEEDVIEIIENEKFCLHDNCHTLEDVIKFRNEMYEGMGGSYYSTPIEIDINEIWLDTKIGIIILD